MGRVAASATRVTKGELCAPPAQEPATKVANKTRASARRGVLIWLGGWQAKRRPATPGVRIDPLRIPTSYLLVPIDALNWGQAQHNRNRAPNFRQSTIRRDQRAIPAKLMNTETEWNSRGHYHVSPPLILEILKKRPMIAPG
jgi:hypothetical protein